MARRMGPILFGVLLISSRRRRARPVEAGELERLQADLARAEQDRAAATALAERYRARCEEGKGRHASERLRLERALDGMVAIVAETDAERMLLLRATTEMIAWYDRHGICRYVSPACLDVVGYDPAELVGKPGVDLVHPDDRRLLGGARLTAGDITLTARLLRKDGTLAHVEATLSPLLHGASRELVGIEVSVRRRREGVETGRQLHRAPDHDPLTGPRSPGRFREEPRTELGHRRRVRQSGRGPRRPRGARWPPGRGAR